LQEVKLVQVSIWKPELMTLVIWGDAS
jgi:hypothetical protein